MSGICGIVTFDGASVDPALIDAMIAAAPHRSLDGSETWIGPGAGLAYLRRSVLAGGTDGQGLAARDGLVCVADARLDERQALVAALGIDLEPGAPPSEADLILAAYERWGDASAERMIGDFAFVIWDERRRRLVAARDPLAMRSLAIRVVEGRSVAFATEIKQLLALPDVPVRLDERAVVGDLLARFGRPEQTFYEGIRNVVPGSALTVDVAGAGSRRFWSVDPTFRIELDDPAAYADLLRDRFVDAVEARIRTERDVGILLSGGVDSGSVAGTAGWLWGAGRTTVPTLRAYQWAFDRFQQCDERDVSRRIVDHYGFASREIAADDLGPLAGFPAHGPDRDDPMLGGFQPMIESALASARDDGVRSMLGGDRGDLVIGGTGWSHLRLAQARRWGDLKAELADHRRATREPWPRIVQEQFVAGLVGRIRGRTPAGWARRLTSRDGDRAGPARPAWLRPSPLVDSVLAEGVIMAPPAPLGHSRERRFDAIFTPLHLRGMAWSERTYARFGLGFADPFSDRRIVELALAVPQVVIARPGDASKPLMRAAMTGLVPEAARVRMTKTVPTPVFEAALAGSARETVRHLMTDPRVSSGGWVDADGWRAEYEAWLADRGDLSGAWWWALGVEIWLRAYW